MKPNKAEVLLVNPFPYYAKGINEATIYPPPLRLAYIATFLEEKGVNCKITDANILRLSNSKIMKEIGKFEPEIVGIYTNIVNTKAGIGLSRKIKESFDKFVVIGDPYATSLVEKTLKESRANCVVRGEGELTMYDLANNLENLSNIKGISYAEDDGGEVKIIHNKNKELIEDLESLPFPAYRLLPDLRSYKTRARASPVGPLLTSRGCPHGCIYCNKNIFGRINFNII